MVMSNHRTGMALRVTDGDQKMTIAILKLEAGQKIARPFNRAFNVEEMAEIVGNFAAVEAVEKMNIKGWTLKRAKANALEAEFAAKVVTANVDSETPILVVGKTKFFAFREM